MTSSLPIIATTTYYKTARQDSPIPLYGVMPAYVNAIRHAGGIPLMIPLGASEEELDMILSRVDGVLLPGGGDIAPARYRGDYLHPAIADVNEDRDRVELRVVEETLNRGKPLLAICRGHQVFNVAMGGTLWEDLATQVPASLKHDYFSTSGYARNYLSHGVSIAPGSRLSECLQTTEIMVNSLHHQGIRDLAPGLIATAFAPDGVVEAIELEGYPFAVGVQWHPENLYEDNARMVGLFRGLVRAAAHPERSAAAQSAVVSKR